MYLYNILSLTVFITLALSCTATLEGNKKGKIENKVEFHSETINLRYAQTNTPKPKVVKPKNTNQISYVEIPTYVISEVPQKITAVVDLTVDPKSGSTTSEMKKGEYKLQPLIDNLNNRGQLENNPQKQTKFIRFHLLNNNLGGLAENSNLILTTASLNQLYESEVESKMKYFTATPEQLSKKIADIEKKLKNPENKNSEKQNNQRLQKLVDQKADIELNKYRENPMNKIKLEVEVHYIQSDIDIRRNLNGKWLDFYQGDPVPHSLTVKVTPIGDETFKEKFKEKFNKNYFKMDGDSLETNLVNSRLAEIKQEKFDVDVYDKDKHFGRTRFDLDEQEYKMRLEEQQKKRLRIDEESNKENKRQKISEDEKIRGKSCGKNSKSRRKRSVPTNGCVFVINNFDEKAASSSQLKNLAEIDSEEFMKEYGQSDSSGKQAMVEAAETNKGKVAGNPEDTEKVFKVFEYENMKKHNAKAKYAFDSLQTADFFGKKAKTNGYSQSELLKDSQLSPTKTAKSLSLGKGAEKNVGRAGKVSGAIGKYLLAKSIVSGIANGDTTGLAIMGGRIGGEAGLEAIAKFGAKVATKRSGKIGIYAAAKAAKRFKILGIAAGPIGSVVDVCLSGWAISKSVQRLNDPNSNKFEQNEAIADIVQESVDIAITGVVTVASLAFPHLAPLFAVVGFFANLLMTAATLLYKGQNHVHNLDSEIKLLDYEKLQELGRHLIGKDTSEYLENLVRLKRANDIAVDQTVAFLQQSSPKIGRAIPSRTFDFGNCKLIRIVCRHYLFAPSKCDDSFVIATECYKGGKCKHSRFITCETTVEKHFGLFEATKEINECECEKTLEIIPGFPHPNNKVDLREEKDVFLERSAPDQPNDKDYTNLCLPSSLKSQGDTSSNRYTNRSYLCENAIVVKRKSGLGSYMLFELEDGDDEVYLNSADQTSNYFIVQDGKKYFNGGMGSDTFLISGPCTNLSGFLNGMAAGENNIIAVDQTCAPGKGLSINLNSSILTAGWRMVELVIENIEIIYGRPGEYDHITTSCDTQYIEGRGGKSRSKPDKIEIREYSNCNYNLTVLVDEYTNVFTWATNGQIMIIIPRLNNYIYLGYMDVGKVSGRTVALFQMPVHYLTAQNFQVLYENVVKLKLTFEDRQNIYIEMKNANITQEYFHMELTFEETHGSNSRIIVHKEKGLAVFHTLETTFEYATRLGAHGIPNIFQLGEGNWMEVNGGKENDEFLLLKTNFTGRLLGGGGIDAFYLSDGLDEEIINVDLRNNLIRGLEGQISIEEIETIFGRSGKQDVVYCNCATTLVNLKEGLGVYLVDRIILEENLNCTSMELTIFVPHFTEVQNSATTGNFTYVVTHQDHFKISIQLLEMTNHFYQFRFGITNTSSLRYKESSGLIVLNTMSNNTISVLMNDVRNPHLQKSHPGIQFLDIDGNGNIVKSDVRLMEDGVIYLSINVTESFDGNITGVQGCRNEIVIDISESGTVGPISGANLDDNFWLASGQHIDSIDGGSFGTNGITILQQFLKGQILTIDLRPRIGSISYGSHTVVHELKNIQKFYGRLESQDEVYAACDTTFVEFADTVWITDYNCSDYYLTIRLYDETTVKFMDLGETGILGGSFIYKFETLRSFDINFDYPDDMHRTKHIFHLKFKINDLSSIVYSDEVGSKIRYVISNETFEHYIDPQIYYYDQQFLSQPKLLSADGFHIQIDRQGEILMASGMITLGISLEDIQSNLIPEYENIANRIDLSIMVETKLDFIYVGSGHKNLESAVPNVLTNTDKRSHLVGSGGSNTVYVILDLRADVYIYSGFKTFSGQVQTIDLTEVIWKIRDETQTKYVAKVRQNSKNDLEIFMEGFDSKFPGKVIIVNCTEHTSQLQFLLNAVIMKLEQVDYYNDADSTEEIMWILKPVPIVVPRGSLFTLSADDLEEHQEIIYDNKNSSSSDFEDFDSNYTGTFESVRNGNGLIVTNLASSSDMSQVGTLVLIDFYDNSARNSSGLGSLQNVVVNFGNLSVNLSGIDTVVVSETRDWEDVLEDSEALLLQNIPEITPEFQIPQWQKIWKRQKYLLYFLTAICLTAYAICFFIVCHLLNSRNYIYIVNSNSLDSNQNGDIELVNR